MAYRKNSRSTSRRTRSSFSARRSTRSTSRNTRRSSGVRSTRRSGAQTLKIVVETAPASAVARPLNQVERPPKKARF